MMIIYKAKIVLILQWEHVVSSDVPWFARYLMLYDPRFRQHLLRLKTSRTMFYIIFNLAFILTQQSDFHAGNLVWMVMWMLCNCSSACFCNSVWKDICLSLVNIYHCQIIPECLVWSCLWWNLISACCPSLYDVLLSLLCGSFSWVACCISYMNKYAGMSVDVHTVWMLGFIPSISLSMSPVCFYHNNRSAVKRSCPCLYIILIVYWWILSSMHL